MSWRCAIVVTSVYDGGFLRNYVRQIVAEGLEERCDIILILDEKSPPAILQSVRAAGEEGVRVICPSLQEQDAYLKSLGAVAAVIPRRSCLRRNIGYLMGYERGYDFLISMDDDNYCLSGQPFIREHAVVLEDTLDLPAVHSENGWFNVCRLLELERDGVYPRGFPYAVRAQGSPVHVSEERGAVYLNAGLWLGDPDLDAVTRLAGPVRATGFSGRSYLLGAGTWSPVNTQNTALRREAIAGYFYVRTHEPVWGMTIHRFGDIFSGYFLQACIRHLGYRIRVGSPLTEHRRHSHDCFEDLKGELPGIRVMEEFLPWLREVRLEGSTCAEVYRSLSERIDEGVENFSGRLWEDGSAVRCFHKIAGDMRAWLAALDALKGVGV